MRNSIIYAKYWRGGGGGGLSTEVEMKFWEMSSASKQHGFIPRQLGGRNSCTISDAKLDVQMYIRNGMYRLPSLLFSVCSDASGRVFYFMLASSDRLTVMLGGN